MNIFKRLSLLCIGLSAVGTLQAQLDYNAVKFSYKSLNPTYDGVIRKLSKDDRVYSKYNYSFQFNYPAEIEQAAGGQLYGGHLFCKWVASPAEADSVTIQVNMGQVQVLKTLRDETARISLDVDGVLRHYQLAYPSEVLVYKKGELVRQISFFTPERPLEFRFSKELTDRNLTGYGIPFANAMEINDHEKSGKVRKEAEKFAYFAAMQKANEIIKTLYGDYNYEFEMGVMTIKPKKASADYTDIIGSAATLEQAINAFKKNDLVLRDSLARKAKREFEQYASSTDAKMVPVTKEVVNYNLMVCHALLGETAKAKVLLNTHNSTTLQRYEGFSGRMTGWYLDAQSLREQLRNEAKMTL